MTTNNMMNSYGKGTVKHGKIGNLEPFLNSADTVPTYQMSAEGQNAKYQLRANEVAICEGLHTKTSE
jgi:hypothetical protein